jgi:hypothetical protein
MVWQGHLLARLCECYAEAGNWFDELTTGRKHIADMPKADRESGADQSLVFNR